MLNDTQAWWLSLALGLTMITLYSWSRFDEPVSETQSNYFTVFKPRFHTSSKSFLYAKIGYIFVILAFYFGLCFSPELLSVLFESDADVEQPAIPLALAAAITSLQNVRLIRGTERRLRGFLHSVARIPHAVRRTVAQMRSAGFDVNKYGDQATYDRIAQKLPTTELNTYIERTAHNLYQDDDLFRPWWRMACLLDALDEKNRVKFDIDPLFFDRYQDELDSIRARHSALLYEVNTYIASIMKRKTTEPLPMPDTNMVQLARKTRDRLYTFIACGLLSSTSSQKIPFVNLKKFGFEISEPGGSKFPIWKMLGLFFIVIVIATFITTGTTKFYLQKLPDLPNIDWENELGLPKTQLGLLSWSWKTALFYFSVIMPTIAARQSYISRRRWFNLQSRDRHRPFLQYIWPMVLGAFCGWATLSIIIFAEFFGLSGFTPKGPIDTMYEAAIFTMHASLNWVFMTIIIAFIALYISDRDTKADTHFKILLRSILGGLAAGLAGFAVFKFVGLDAPLPSETIIGDKSAEFTIIKSSYIALFIFMLCWALQFIQHSHAKAKIFGGKLLRISNNRGPQFIMRFYKNGSSRAYARDETGFDDNSELDTGSWIQIPEGTVIHWSGSGGNGETTWCSQGLITVEGSSTIYEGYSSLDAGERQSADFVGQVEVLNA